ncbi:ribonuclease P protein component [Candidatus Peregrinibacteria bacterium]|nr:ribonuclease P protein component [Candidatus Peregrinibacteria bacterium]
MIAQKYKIRSKPRVLHILKKGRMFKWGVFYLRSLPNRAGHPRFSLILSKKIGRKAVERNKIRRRVYEVIRKNFSIISKTCYDVVVLCSARIGKTDYAQIERDMIQSLKRL